MGSFIRLGPLSKFEAHEAMLACAERMMTVQRDETMEAKERAHRLFILRSFIDKLSIAKNEDDQ